MGEYAIGQPVPRFEDPRLVKGGGRYIADMMFPGTAHGFVLRSPHAHARIRSIDTAKAKAAPGVLAVLTGADYKAAGFGDLSPTRMLRLTLPSATLCLLGVEAIFASFFLSLLGLNRR